MNVSGLGRYGKALVCWISLVFQKWLLSLSGSLSALWGLIEHIRGKSAMPYWWFAGSIFILAIFLVWCDMFWEARPYEKETYRHAQNKFANLSDSGKMLLEEIAIAKSIPDTGPASQEIYRTGFLDRAFADASYSLKPDFAKIVPRLVREWRSDIEKE
jgi:hypothetical protein